jgi:UDP-GlcNAc:undecaprenyl-phosphate GlcNAc-1-phosphate transferase
MRLGHGPRRTVVILWAWTAVLSGVALVPTFTHAGNALVPFAVAAMALLLFAWFHPGFRLRRQRSERARHPSSHPGDEEVGPVVDLAERRAKRA